MQRSASTDSRAVTADLAHSLAHRRNFRSAVREMAAYALNAEGTSAEQLRAVLDALAQGISEGAMQARVDPELAVPEAFAGLEDAVARFVERQAAGSGNGPPPAAEVSRLLLEAAERAHARAGPRLRHAWARVLETHKPHGTGRDGL